MDLSLLYYYYYYNNILSLLCNLKLPCNNSCL